ncbi:hypothetical protein ACTXT7_002509 [Hymenolepis weldensis]
MNGVAKEPQSQKRNHSEPDPPQTDSDDSSSTIIIPETEFDTKQSHTYNREHSKELPLIAGDPNSKRGEKKQCSPERAHATHKRLAKWKGNAQKPEVATPTPCYFAALGRKTNSRRHRPLKPSNLQMRCQPIVVTPTSTSASKRGSLHDSHLPVAAIPTVDLEKRKKLDCDKDESVEDGARVPLPY